MKKVKKKIIISLIFVVKNLLEFFSNFIVQFLTSYSMGVDSLIDFFP